VVYFWETGESIKTDRLDEAAAVLDEYIAHPVAEHPRPLWK
jgi:hypothetical protein